MTPRRHIAKVYLAAGEVLQNLHPVTLKDPFDLEEALEEIVPLDKSFVRYCLELRHISFTAHDHVSGHFIDYSMLVNPITPIETYPTSAKEIAKMLDE